MSILSCRTRGKKIMFCMYNQGNNNRGWKISRTALGLRRWEQVLGRVDLSVCAIGHLCALQCACQVSGSEEWRRRAFPRLRPFAGLGTGLWVSLKQRERVRERAAPPCPWAGREKVHAEDDNVTHQRRQPVHSICYSIILVKCLGIFPSHDLFSTQPFYVPLLHFGVS